MKATTAQKYISSRMKFWQNFKTKGRNQDTDAPRDTDFLMVLLHWDKNISYIINPYDILASFENNNNNQLFGLFHTHIDQLS